MASVDYFALQSMRENHPAWRLLCATHAPLIASFLHRVFVEPNIREMDEPDLVEKLEDELFALRDRLGDKEFKQQPIDYLTEWTQKGWLRRFYKEGSDEPFFDLTPPTERSIAWLVGLTERSFVGTESRLMTLFELLKQLMEGTETDPEARISELEKRRAEIDAEIERLWDGNISLLSDTGIRERFMQFQMIAKELLADFREVEQNFRTLDRRARERIAKWEGRRGQLLDEILGERDQISDTDQGRSFRAFWDFLMSQSRQEELTRLLEHALALPSIAELNPDTRLKNVHYDWLEAGDHTQRVVARLSEQLRRFLDDTALLENKRIMELLGFIEKRALDLRDFGPAGDFMEINLPAAEIELPMERPLYTPPIKPRITEAAVEADESNIDPSSLFSQIVVDKAALKQHIRQSLQHRRQITLQQLIAARPLEKGMAELLAYWELATNVFATAVDEDEQETVTWRTDEGLRQATMPRLIFSRGR